MPVASCLYRRPSGIYAVRLAVPMRLRSEIGRTEIHVSTGLREPGAAKIAALKIQAEWRDRFMTVDTSRLTNPSPLLQGDGLISLPGAAAATGLGDRDLLSELLNERAALVVQATGWRGWRVADSHAVERDHDETYITNSIEAEGQEAMFSGLARCWNDRRTIAALRSSGQSSEQAFKLAGRAAFFVQGEVDVPLSDWMVQKGVVRLIQQRLAAAVPPAPVTPTPALVGAPMAVGASRYGGRRFSELLALYVRDRGANWKPDSHKRTQTEAGLFIDLMDDPTMDQIDIELIHEFASRLAELPTDIYQSRRRYGEVSLRDLAALAKDKDLELKKPATVTRHVTKIAEILNFGVKPAGWLRINPASGFQKSRSFGKKPTRAQDDRDAFEAHDLDLIFSATWFRSGGRGETAHWRPHYYWLPLLALLTGGRLNELSQLYLDDIRQSEAGTWYIDFNLEGDKLDIDDEDSTDKSLKTVNSIRVVPLHQTIIQAGLPAYVAALRKAGHTRLFPELKRDRIKGYGKPVGSWFNERFLGIRLEIERNGKKTFHSFRHNFVTALERLDLPERVMAQFAGHQRGQGQSGTRYAKDREAVELQSLMDRLSFSCLDELNKFDAAAGLRAIHSALRRKEAAARSAKS